MKTRLAQLACLLLMLALATRAFALAGDLKDPGLAFPKDFPESVRTTMTDALTHKDCTFLGGRFINSFTNLRYQGETTALNQFLAGLVKCPGVILTIRFQPENPNTPVNYDWLLAHTADQPHKLEAVS
jgi:hypothetical protein